VEVTASDVAASRSRVAVLAGCTASPSSSADRLDASVVESAEEGGVAGRNTRDAGIYWEQRRRELREGIGSQQAWILGQEEMLAESSASKPASRDSSFDNLQALVETKVDASAPSSAKSRRRMTLPSMLTIHSPARPANKPVPRDSQTGHGGTQLPPQFMGTYSMQRAARPQQDVFNHWSSPSRQDLPRPAAPLLSPAIASEELAAEVRPARSTLPPPRRCPPPHPPNPPDAPPNPLADRLAAQSRRLEAWEGAPPPASAPFFLARVKKPSFRHLSGDCSRPDT